MTHQVDFQMWRDEDERLGGVTHLTFVVT